MPHPLYLRCAVLKGWRFGTVRQRIGMMRFSLHRISGVILCSPQAVTLA